MRYNGVLQLQNAMNFIWLGQRTNQSAPRDLIDWDRVYRRLPLLTALDDLGERPFYREIIRHPCFDEFWASHSMKGQYGEVETPAYFITAGTTICCTKFSSASRAGGNRPGGGKPASNRASWWGRGPIH